MRIKKSFYNLIILSFFLLGFLLYPLKTSAAVTRPYYGWTRTIGGTGLDISFSIATDNDDNIIAIGYFSGNNVEFNTTGSGPSVLRSSAGSVDAFINKYNSNGSYAWTRTFGGTSLEQAQSIAIDNNRNIYIAGQFASTNVEFNTTGSGSSDIKSSAGLGDIFITKFNSDGSYGWTRAIGGTGSDFGLSVAVDDNGNAYLSGQLGSSNVEFNTTGSGSSDVRSTAGLADIFVTKYSSNGSYVWTKTIGGTGGEQATSVNVDNNGNIYLTGFFASTNIEFNTTGSGASDIKSTTGGPDVFLTKYNANGSYGWTTAFGGTSDDRANSITTDGNGNIYIAGGFSSANMQFNTTGSGSSYIASSSGQNDIFISKYTSNGSYSWTRTISGTGDDAALKVITDNEGNVYLNGYFASSNVEFNTTGSGESDIKSTVGSFEVFVTKYNTDSSYAWTYSMGGTGVDVGRSIAVDNDENLYLSGSTSSSNIEFNTTGFGSSDIRSTAGSNDIFITKLTDTEISVNLLESGITSNESISLNENNDSGSYEIVLSAEPTDNVTVSLSFESGISISTSTLTFTTLNWNIPQTINVSAVNDSIVSGNRSVTISHTVTSNDSLYNGISIPDMTVNIIEDDTATTSTTKKASAGVGLGNGTDAEVELEEESEEESEFTITPTPTKTIKPTDLPETGKDGKIKGSGIKFTTVALCSFPLVIVVIIMILAAKRKKKQNEN